MCFKHDNVASLNSCYLEDLWGPNENVDQVKRKRNHGSKRNLTSWCITKRGEGTQGQKFVFKEQKYTSSAFKVNPKVQIGEYL